jgi:hypothetical protein
MVVELSFVKGPTSIKYGVFLAALRRGGREGEPSPA